MHKNMRSEIHFRKGWKSEFHALNDHHIFFYLPVFVGDKLIGIGFSLLMTL